MENNLNEKKKNEFIFNYIRNINDIKTKSYDLKNNQCFNNNISNDLLKEKDKKIEDLKKQCEELKKQLEIKNDSKPKKDEQLWVLKNINKNNVDNNFNTSTNFPVKNEIKKTWEELALVSILDTFIDFEDEPEKIFHIISEMILIMDKLINDLCKEIYEKVCLSLNIPVNDKKFINDIEKISRPLIKEHLNKIFIDTESKSFIEKFIDLFKSSLKNNNILDSVKKDNETIEQIIKSEEFIQMTKKIKDILLYTKFNDQQLFFKIEPDIKKRNVEKIIVNNILDKKQYLIINNNNLINSPAIVILNPPVMKNGFPLNNDFKMIIMLINENNYKYFKRNIAEKKYKIYTNSFTIYDNNKNNKNSNEKTDILNISNENLSLPATIINENKDKTKNIKKELKSSFPKINISKIDKSENIDNKRFDKNNNILLNRNLIKNIQNSNILIDNISHININSTFVKQHKPFMGNPKNNLNKNSFEQKEEEVFYDSLLQSEYLNSPKNISDHSFNHEQEILISINNEKMKDFYSINNTNNNNNYNYYKNNYLINSISNKQIKTLNKNKKRNLQNLSYSRRNISQKKVKKRTNNHSDKNIYKNNLKNENFNSRHTTKEICSTDINSYNNFYNNDNLYLKKYRTVKEMNKSKNVTKITNDKFLFSLHSEDMQNSSENRNLYKNNIKKFIKKQKKDIDLFKEHLKIRKKKLQNFKINKNIYKNYNFHKFDKNKINNNEYKSIQHDNYKKSFNSSHSNSNTIYASSNNNRNIKNNNKKICIKDHSYNYNIRRSSKNNRNSNNNNINQNSKFRQQISSSSTTLKNSTINTGFKIKNVNINYFNIMQPNDIFFEQQRTNRTKSRQNISNISNNTNKKSKRNKNLKTNKYSKMNLNKNNSLFLMTDLIDITKIKDNMRKHQKGLITKLQDIPKHNDSCFSNDIKMIKINSNEQKKIRITKQLERLNGSDIINSFDKNKKRILKKKNLIGNFSKSNNKQMIFIKIPNKNVLNNSRQKNMNNQLINIDKQNNKKAVNENNNFKNFIFQNQAKNEYVENKKMLVQTFSNNNNININIRNNQQYYNN